MRIVLVQAWTAYTARHGRSTKRHCSKRRFLSCKKTPSVLGGNLQKTQSNAPANWAVAATAPPCDKSSSSSGWLTRSQKKLDDLFICSVSGPSSATPPQNRAVS